MVRMWLIVEPLTRTLCGPMSRHVSDPPPAPPPALLPSSVLHWFFFFFLSPSQITRPSPKHHPWSRFLRSQLRCFSLKKLTGRSLCSDCWYTFSSLIPWKKERKKGKKKQCTWNKRHARCPSAASQSCDAAAWPSCDESEPPWTRQSPGYCRCDGSEGYRNRTTRPHTHVLLLLLLRWDLGWAMLIWTNSRLTELNWI